VGEHLYRRSAGMQDPYLLRKHVPLTRPLDNDASPAETSTNPLLASFASQDFHVYVKVPCLTRRICRGEYTTFTFT